MDTLFEQYVSLRLQGNNKDEAQRHLINGIGRLSLSEQVSLKQRFLRWENERTEAELNAKERMDLSNSTIRIVTCAACDSPNVVGVTNCQICGQPLFEQNIPNFNEIETAWADLKQTDVLRTKLSLVLFSTNSKKPFALRPKFKTAQVKLGRSQQGNKVDVDLTELGAGEMGVSRSHCLIEYDDDISAFYIIDLDSTNGTYVNSIKLPANARTRLRDGDEIALGQLKLSIGLKQIVTN